MHRPSLSLAALGLLAGCSKPGPQQQQAAAPAGVQWAVVVLYNHPKDTAAFEKYYAETHVPLFASHAQEIGVTRAELIKFASTADGKPPTLYREADLRFDSKEALEKGTATPGFKAVAADLANFATGGVTVLVFCPINTVTPPVAKFAKSAATALNPGVAVPFSSASFESNRRSASRYSVGGLPSAVDANLISSARVTPISWAWDANSGTCVSA